MILAPSTINLGKSKIRISIIVTIVELILLVIGGLWMMLRKIPVHIKVTPEAFLLGIVMGIFVLLSSAIFYYIDSFVFNLKMRKLIENVIYPAFSKVTVPEILLIAVLSGFCEEFFFRGILVPEFGIVIACGIFGFLHTPSKDAWFLGLWSALVGAFFAIVYLKTGNLFVPIVAHAFNNLVAITYIRFAHDLMKKKMGDTAEDKQDDEKGETPSGEEASDEEDEDVIDFPPVGIPEDETIGDKVESSPDETKEEDEKKVSSPVRLLDPSMLKGKIPTEDKDEEKPEIKEEEETESETKKAPPVPEPAYEPMPHYQEKKTERKNLLPDFDTLLGRKKEKKVKTEDKPAAKIEKPSPEKSDSPVTLLKELPTGKSSEESKEVKPIAGEKADKDASSPIPPTEAKPAVKASVEKPTVSPVKIKKIDLEFKPVKKAEEKETAADSGSKIPDASAVEPAKEEVKPVEKVVEEKKAEKEVPPVKKEPEKVEIRMDKRTMVSGEDKQTVRIGNGGKPVEAAPEKTKGTKPEDGLNAIFSQDKKPSEKDMEKKRSEGKEPPKGSIRKDRRADDIDDEGIGVVNEPQ